MFLWWNSLSAVSSMNVIAQWVAAIAGAIAAIATISVVILSGRQTNLQRESDEQREFASNAQITEIKNLTDELKQIQAPWQLTDEQKKVLLSALTNAPKGPVAVEYIRSDEKRVYNFAATISELLKALGYDVWGYMPGFEQAGSAPLVGVMIQVKIQESSEVANYLQQGFEKIGIKVVRASRNNNNHPDATVVIWIGSKPEDN